MDSQHRPELQRLARDEQGNALVFVALFLGFLTFAIALAFDMSLLTVEKNRLQHAAEAAALAALGSIPDGQEAVERDVSNMLEANGVDGAAIEVQVGYYDAYEQLTDFPTYTDFIEVDSGEFPEDTYPNAVLVILRQETPTIAIESEGAGEGGVAVSAVAYLRDYGIAALGDYGIDMSGHWVEGFPHFIDCPIHSNADIDFIGTETFEGNSPVSAVGLIDDGPGTSGAERMYVAPIDWDALRADADIVFYPQDWEEGIQEEEMYYYGRVDHAMGAHVFVPKPGDHGGTLYYFALHDPNSSPALIQLSSNMDSLWEIWETQQDWHAYNFTIACEGKYSISIYYHYGAGIHFGNPGYENVYIYTRGDIYIQDNAGTWDPAFLFDGVVFRTEQRFTYYSHTRVGMNPYTLKARILAEDVFFRSAFWPTNAGKALFDPHFGPWIPPLFPNIGVLAPTSGEGT